MWVESNSLCVCVSLDWSRGSEWGTVGEATISKKVRLVTSCH